MIGRGPTEEISIVSLPAGRQRTISGDHLSLNHHVQSHIFIGVMSMCTGLPAPSAVSGESRKADDRDKDRDRAPPPPRPLVPIDSRSILLSAVISHLTKA